MPPKKATKPKESKEIPFAWLSCADETDTLKRLEIKEQACRDAQLHAQEIDDILFQNVQECKEMVNPSLCPDDVRGWGTQLCE